MILLRALFENTKQYDELSEWEFVQTIMREKYIHNMYETKDIIANKEIYETIAVQNETGNFQRQILSENIAFIQCLIRASNETTDIMDKIRLSLVAYCYIIEMKYWQEIVANLLWIQLGYTFYIDPFAKSVLEHNLDKQEQKELKGILKIKEFDTFNNTEKRIKTLCFLCKKAKLFPMAEYIDFFYNNHLRNSFYHSKYIFDQNGYIGFDRKNTVKFDINELGLKIDKCIFFYQNLMTLIDESRASYKKTTKIKGRRIDYKNNNIHDKCDLADIILIANNRMGIVQTMITVGGKNAKKDSENFINSYIKFSEDYDLHMNNNI